MADRNEQYAYFSLLGKFDPAEITAAIGIHPSRSWKDGDVVEGRIRTFSTWSLKSRLVTSELLEEHIQDVLDQLAGHSKVIQSLACRFKAKIQLVGYFWNHYPGLRLEAKTVHELAEYGVAIDMDFYGLGTAQEKS